MMTYFSSAVELKASALERMLKPNGFVPSNAAVDEETIAAVCCLLKSSLLAAEALALFITCVSDLATNKAASNNIFSSLYMKPKPATALALL
ncbi:hypothetical protein D3C85_1144840 [compost metagenome]